MKKFVFTLVLSFLVTFVSAQVMSADRMNARLSFHLRGYRIDTIKNDTSNMLGASRSVMTADAIYKFVAGRQSVVIGGGGGGIVRLGNVGSLWMVRINDSTYASDTSTANA